MIPVTIIRMLFHPVVLISLFGPLILSINLIALRDSLSFPYGATEIIGGFPELKAILKDNWAYALVDFNIQLYTLLLAWIIFFVESFIAGIPLLRRLTLTGFVRRIQSSKFSMWFCVGLVVLFMGGIVLMFSGMLSEAGTVQKYLPKGLHVRGGIRVPPPDSPITWFRGVILAFGLLLSYWQQKIIPGLMENTQ